MPGRPHHTDKMKRCVDHILAKGYPESSAYAICTTTLQEADEPIFENAEAHSAEEIRLLGSVTPAGEIRDLHLLGATGHPRTEMLNGREYLVVPVVSLMEGVIHAVNAATPEFVPLATLQKAAASWNGRPVTIGHPKKDGKQCSANSPDVLASHGIGVIMNSRVDGRKLLQEAWIDKPRLKQLNPEMLTRLESNKTEEVSVGAFVVTDGKAGVHNGREYKASWRETAGDHLAFLPGGKGACSCEMGCGTHRAAMKHIVTAAAIEPVAAAGKMMDCPMCDGSGSKNGNPCEACDGTGEVQMRASAGARHSAGDMKMIQDMHDNCVALGAECDRNNYKMLEVKIDGQTVAGITPRFLAEKTVVELDSKQLFATITSPTRIRSEGGRWALYSKDGLRKLGEHHSKEAAEAQACAIEAILARGA